MEIRHHYLIQLPISKFSVYDVSLIASVDVCKDSLTIIDYIEVVDPNFILKKIIIV